MVLLWTLVSTSLLLASTLATLFTMLHLRCRWDVHASSVRWLFWFFFLWVFIWCLMRATFFVWMSSRPVLQIADTTESPEYSYSQLDRLGIHSILYLREATDPFITAIVCAGDLGIFGVTLTLFPLTYELMRLARKSMDRGLEKEQQRIRLYGMGISACIVLYALAQVVLAVKYGGYNTYIRKCLLGVYILKFIGMLFMVYQLVVLKLHGRKYETVHGTFVASPAYQRLKRIMIVYVVFECQFQLAMVVFFVLGMTPDHAAFYVLGVSLMFSNFTGLALSITTSCSQACVFSACSSCLPRDFEATRAHLRFTVPADDDLEAPSVNPVFVYTDIEASTALWSMDGEMMVAATEVHDLVLRSSLPKHRGYEITTVGDAFQMAFHNISDAVEYCVDVQLQLMMAKWPKELHGAVSATAKQHVGRRLVFNGLRVRMGIHDASPLDGVLIQDVHAVTGKTTYSGVSEMIAEYVGDLGSGGQILVTERVAEWLKSYHDVLSVDTTVEYVGRYTVPQMNLAVEVHQMQPAMLAARTKLFAMPAHEPSATPRQRGGSGRIHHARTLSTATLPEIRTPCSVASDAKRVRRDSLPNSSSYRKAHTPLHRLDEQKSVAGLLV